MNKLFSYGTLQLANVQLELFGRLLNAQKDTLIGYRLDFIEITDAGVIEKSNSDKHPILIETGNTNDIIEGAVLELTDEEILQADEYEVDDYKRISVRLQSGNIAWVYVKK